MVRRLLLTAIPIALLAGDACAPLSDDPDEGDFYEGVGYDDANPNAPIEGGKDDGAAYEVPTGLPTLVDPEIIVSLDGLTIHLFDRQTGFSEVYPVGVGVINSDGLSITPTGHFASGPDTQDTWWYVARRTVPAAFGGYPFLRLTAENSRGENTYGIHGPITERLIRGYVSHGCVRMEGSDVVRVFYLVRAHASTPVTIQREVEIDAAGQPVDVGSHVTLWEPGAEIEYGDSVGDPPPRDDTGTDLDGCADDRLESDDPVPVEPGTYRGLVLCAGDLDRYSIAVDEGAQLWSRIQFASQVGDLNLRVLDQDGLEVASSAGSGDTEEVSVEAESTGTYTIEVNGAAGAETNSYFLFVAVN